jgi:hypothetical protein
MQSNFQIIAYRLVAFALLAVLFWVLTPNVAAVFWAILLLAAVAWFALEYRFNPKFANVALLWGLGLALIDFVIENAGAAAGLWFTKKSFLLLMGAVPTEVSLLAIIGGAAWMMRQPPKLDWYYIVADAVVFAGGGAAGEWLLIQNGIMRYSAGWNSALAFATYFITWLVLNWAWYRYFRKD